jgi:hypothetical protein
LGFGDFKEGIMRRLFLKLAIAGLAVATPSSLFASTPQDDAVNKQIVASLHDSGKLHHYHIGVKADGSTVFLNGTVASQEQLKTALDIVQDTPNIEKIVNGIRVAPESSQASPTVHTAMASESQVNVRPQLALDSQPDFSSSSNAGSSSVMSGGHGSGAPLPLSASPAGFHRAMPVNGQPMPGAGAEQVTTGQPIPAYVPGPGGGVAPAHYDRPAMPGYAWPSYASYPNYAALTYPRQYSPTAWPFIGPFYPYPQVPLGWRKVSLEWHNGWWMLDFNDNTCGHY